MGSQWSLQQDKKSRDLTLTSTKSQMLFKTSWNKERISTIKNRLEWKPWCSNQVKNAFHVWGQTLEKVALPSFRHPGNNWLKDAHLSEPGLQQPRCQSQWPWSRIVNCALRPRIRMSGKVHRVSYMVRAPQWPGPIQSNKGHWNAFNFDPLRNNIQGRHRSECTERERESDLSLFCGLQQIPERHSGLKRSSGVFASQCAWPRQEANSVGTETFPGPQLQRLVNVSVPVIGAARRQLAGGLMYIDLRTQTSSSFILSGAWGFVGGHKRYICPNKARPSSSLVPSDTRWIRWWPQKLYISK